jgi:transcriptional regulator with GAF, ATPase, and Fis domain
MRTVLEQARLVARTGAYVLVTGETGTGKELIAHAIHGYSPRAHKEPVELNCAALPDHLAESELFGFERGAFSGAANSKPGLFEMAAAGTLVLDEIGELDLHLQAKLLRVLDGAPYYRLGGTKKVTPDARIIALTNRDLSALCTEGKFRTDLHHRLAQFHIRIPPLRDRRDDVGPLTRHFLPAGRSFAPEAMDCLERYSWPGNVRELKNIVLRCVTFTEANVIGLDHLPAEIRSGEQVRSRLDDWQKQMILLAMSEAGGHQRRAAQRLGISPRTLSRRLKQYGAKAG